MLALTGWKKNRFFEIQKESYRKWQPWFAWRPVQTISGQWVWWDYTYRKVANSYSDDMDLRWYFYADEFDILKYD